MSKLILSFEGTVLTSVTIGKNRITIGRKPENDIQVDNLAVSGFHAVVSREGNDVVLEDLNSTNGTVVNGQTIQKYVLKNFDVVELGKHKLKYLAETIVAQPGMDKTVVMRRPVPLAAHDTAPPVSPPAASAVSPPARPPVAPPASAAALPEAALQVISGAASGRILELIKNLTKVGRAGVQVAVITRRPNGYFLTHVEGVGFPLVNGVSVGAQATQLNDQDTVEIAGTKMSFFYKN